MTEPKGAAGVALQLEREVARVTIDHPRKLNILNRALIDALTETVTALAAEPGLRVVVLAGAG